MSSRSNSYRLAVASRALAAIAGGYMLTALATAALAVFLPVLLPMSRASAALTATMLSFGIYAGIVLWVFATRSAWRAWLGILLLVAALEALLRLRPLVGAA